MTEEERVPHPISRMPAKRIPGKKNEWEFIYETKPCLYGEACQEAAHLQALNPTWQYRIWDCRETPIRAHDRKRQA